MPTLKRVDRTLGVEHMLTVKQVVAILQKDEWAVRKLIHAGALAAYDTCIGERTIWRIKPSDLNRFLDTRRSTA